MSTKIPPKLYKYQRVDPNTHTLENLQKGQIWFSKPSSLNDPFDCAIPFNIKGTDQEYQELYDRLINALKDPGKLAKTREIESKYLTNGKPNATFKQHMISIELQENKKKIAHFGQMGIASFSENVNNLLMWSHYSDGHNGLCLEFDTRYFPFEDPQIMHHVIYSDSYPILSPVAIFHSPNMPFDPLITKAKDWRYEKEWRLIKPEGDSPVIYEPRALTAIYFGCSMPDTQIHEIVIMPARSAARLFRMQRSDTKFKLSPLPYKE